MEKKEIVKQVIITAASLAVSYTVGNILGSAINHNNMKTFGKIVVATGAVIIGMVVNKKIEEALAEPVDKLLDTFDFETKEEPCTEGA